MVHYHHRFTVGRKRSSVRSSAQCTGGY